MIENLHKSNVLTDLRVQIRIALYCYFSSGYEKCFHWIIVVFYIYVYTAKSLFAEEFWTKNFHAAKDQMCFPGSAPPSVWINNSESNLHSLIPRWHYSVYMLPPISSLLMVTFLPFYTSFIRSVILTLKQLWTHAEREQRSTVLELEMKK